MKKQTKPVIKKKFDYDIPIAKVDDACLTTTGAASKEISCHVIKRILCLQNSKYSLDYINNEVTYAMNMMVITLYALMVRRCVNDQ